MRSPGSLVHSISTSNSVFLALPVAGTLGVQKMQAQDVQRVDVYTKQDKGGVTLRSPEKEIPIYEQNI